MDHQLIELKAKIEKDVNSSINSSPINNFNTSIVFDLSHMENILYPNGYQVKHLMIQFEPLTDNLKILDVSYFASGHILDKYVVKDPRWYHEPWTIPESFKKNKVFCFDVPFFQKMPLSKPAPPISVTFHACISNISNFDHNQEVIKNCKLVVLVSSLSDFEKRENDEIQSKIYEKFDLSSFTPLTDN